MIVPRNEYPRPQFKRDEWMCLNGEWQFEIDNGDSGLQRGLLERELKNRIMVPFCPESKLSGIGCKDFMEAVWYRRHINIPGDWREKILLHFQACDYDTTVWVNGHELGSHRGGFTPFCFEISKFTTPGDKAEIVVRARDYSRMHKAAGKQSLNKYNNQGCFYDRTTGIWQTVWLEPVPQCSFNRPRITPDPTGCCFNIQTPLRGLKNKGMHIKAKIFAKDKLISSASICADLQMTPELTLNIPETDMILWEPGQAFLYDVELELLDAGGNVVDRVSSYAGMRAVSLCGKEFLINGKKIFQRQVLDQGYYPDGIMTAPDEETLIKDIELSIAAGFNSARLHQKVFEERFLYHADRLGYMVWGEFGDWGAHHYHHSCFKPTGATCHHSMNAIFRQWAEALERDYSHPAIIGWCPLNETEQQTEYSQITALEDLTHGLYLMTKAMDQSRPVLDSSGYTHFVYEADIFDSHNYEQNPLKFAEDMAALAENKPFYNNNFYCVNYAGQPYFCSEFGGIKWAPEFKDRNERGTSWGYGAAPTSLDEFYARFEGLVNVLLNNPDMFGYCYTQLTDVYQEQNGIYNFDRTPKFDMEKIRTIQSRPAAFEEKSSVYEIKGTVNSHKQISIKYDKQKNLEEEKEVCVFL